MILLSHVLPGKGLPLLLHPRFHAVKAPALRLPPSAWSHLPELLTGGRVGPQKETVCTGEDKLRDDSIGSFIFGKLFWVHLRLRLAKYHISA